MANPAAARAMYWLLADFATLSVVAVAIGRLPVTAAIPEPWSSSSPAEA